MLGKIKDSAAYISRFLEGGCYNIGIILGTGLGELGKFIEIIDSTRPQRESSDRKVRWEKCHCYAGTFSFL